MARRQPAAARRPHPTCEAVGISAHRSEDVLSVRLVGKENLELGVEGIFAAPAAYAKQLQAAVHPLGAGDRHIPVRVRVSLAVTIPDLPPQGRGNIRGNVQIVSMKEGRLSTVSWLCGRGLAGGSRP